MLSLAKLAAPSRGEVSYYEASVARGRDDYYAGRGESPGVWCGTGATATGLAGTVGDGQLTELLHGLHPGTGERVRAETTLRLERVTVIDPDTGDLVVVERERRPVAGFDATFSAPKSVSLLHALGDAAVQATVRQAHEEAVHAAVAYLEDTVCFTRTGRGGANRVRGEGFLAAAFTHRLSRAQDPQLHTHVVIANAVRAADGRWRTLDGRGWAGHMLAAGYLYQSHLRALMVECLGVEFRLVGRGQAEIAGVPAPVLAAFSQRRQQILEHMAATGATGFEAGQVAVLATRPAKGDADLPSLREDWTARAAELGLGRDEITALTPGPRQRTPVDQRRIEDALVAAGDGPPGLTATRTAFRTMEVEMAWAEANPDGLRVDEVRELADATRLRAEVIPVQGAGPASPQLMTTADVVHAQNRIGAFLELTRDRPSRLTAAAVDPLLASLPSEQTAAVRRVLLAPGGVQAMVGVAGGRKTTAIGAAVRVARSAGVPVVLTAPSAQAASVLAEAAGMPASTLHLQLAAGTPIPQGALVVIDEASMADTRTLARYLAMVPPTARVVMVGDDHQLPAVGPGGAFAEVCRTIEPARLERHLRQREAWEARCLDHLRTRTPEGVTAALAGWAEHGRIHQSEDRIVAEARMVRAWWDSARACGVQEAVMIAATRGEVTRLNTAARGLLSAAGKLGEERRFGGIAVAIGDRVACTENRYDLGLRNGMAGTVTSTAPAGVTVRLDDGGSAAVPAEYIAEGHLAHRYALTGHRSQGGTFEHVHVLAPVAGRLAEWGYVALSRHRGPVHIHLCADAVRDAHIPEPTPAAQPLDRLAEALQAPAASGFVHPSPPNHGSNAMTTHTTTPRHPAGGFDEDAWWGRYRAHLAQRPATEDAPQRAGGPSPGVEHLTTEQLRAERSFLERATDPTIRAATQDLIRRRLAGSRGTRDGSPQPLEPPPPTLGHDAVHPDRYAERLRSCDEVLQDRARFGIDRIENLTTRALVAEARWLRTALDPAVRASVDHRAVLERLYAARRDAQECLDRSTAFGRRRWMAERERLTARIRTAVEATPTLLALPEPPPSIRAAGVSAATLEPRWLQVETALRARIQTVESQLRSGDPLPSGNELQAVREAVQALHFRAVEAATDSGAPTASNPPAVAEPELDPA